MLRAKVHWNPNYIIIDKLHKELFGKLSEEAAEDIATLARRLCPVRKSSYIDKYGNKPGTLKKSIRTAKSRFKNGGAVVRVGGKGVWGDAYYASWVEFGSPSPIYKSGYYKGYRRTPRKPVAFLRDAMRAYKRKMKRNFQAGMSRMAA